MVPIQVAAFQSRNALSIVSHGGNGTNCKFGYFLGEYINNLVRYGRLNCTVIEGNQREGFGQLNSQTGMYNGIIGFVQRNITEMTVMITRVPTEKDFFIYGPIVEPTWVTFASTYKLHNSSIFEILDVTSSLISVTRTVWMMAFALMFLFWLLFAFGKLFLRKKRKRFHQRSYWTIVTFAFFQQTIELKGYFFCVTALFLSLFVYWFQQFMENFMTTNFIQPYHPRMVDSYEDIMKLKFHPENGYVDPDSAAGLSDKSQPLKPVFARQARTYSNFKLAQPELIQRKLYDYAARVAGDKNLLIDLRSVFVQPRRHLLHDYFIFIEAFDILNVFRRNACHLIAKAKKVDPNSEIAQKSIRFAKNADLPYFMGHLYSESISPSKRRHLDRQLRKQYEAGLNFRGVATIYEKRTPPRSLIRLCFQDEVEFPIPDIDSLQLRCFKGAMRYLLYFFLASALLLFLEFISYRAFYSRGSKRRSQIRYQQ